MRTLAVDLGARRVGLALSDESAQFATPLEVVQVDSPEHALSLVADAARKHQAQRIVVGLPLNMDDTLGPAAEHAIQWGRKLAGQLALPLIFVDERLSSFQAEQQIIEMKRAGARITRQKKKQRLDALAAAAFLQALLDGRTAPIEV
jgi:putative holliday junction resolvase